MPQNTTQQLPTQVPQNDQKQELNPEKMLLEYLKSMEEEIAQLGQRVDVLEQKAGEQPTQ